MRNKADVRQLWVHALALLWQIYPRHCFYGFVFGSVGIAEIVVEE